MWNIFSLYWICYSIASVLCFGLLATKNARSWLPKERLNHTSTTIPSLPPPLPSHWKVKVLVAQLCPTLCNSIDCIPPESSVHGILQARILEWVAIPFSRGSSRPMDWTRVSWIAGMLFSIWASREPIGRHSLNQCITREVPNCAF